MQTEPWQSNKVVFAALGLPALLWLGVFFVLPLGFIFGLSFSDKSGIIGHDLTWTGGNYLRAFEPLYLGIFGKSLLVALAATAACLLVGYPVALAVAFAPPKIKMPLLLAITLPFWINILIRTYALIAVFRTRGFLNFTLEWFWNAGDSLLRAVGLGGLGDFAPLELLYTNTAVALGVAYVFLPFMILPLYASMERFDRSYLEASLDLGAGHWRTFFKVLLPLTMPGVISGVMIVFVPALGAFFIADMLGGADSQLIGNVIERQFLGANNWPFGAALSFLLMYLTFAAIVLRRLFAARAERADGGGYAPA
ncbi:MAG: ABC transporter permease [Gammaproteobacteria bacterium]|nr:ABC transporter permease [Gammaproteobacteria bacterium]CAJ2377408.1 MAG: spermidine preferential ABC transporter membrane subunit PotB [Arenicellales bacterium IbO2]MDA7970131.1 ABC transporter permease [Gammaproteobacteria bacterium]MDA7972842.1 ABC transporter permease [Gammaproteobacteria bacterium]MDA7995197.1 ABC transporter permease [Gammaproteobacteria bacterium]